MKSESNLPEFKKFLKALKENGCHLSQDEFVKWSVKSDTIYYSNKSVAAYDHSEFELNPNHGRHAKPMHELSIYQFNLGVPTEELIKYVHIIHTKQKIEIVVPRH